MKDGRWWNSFYSASYFDQKVVVWDDVVWSFDYNGNGEVCQSSCNELLIVSYAWRSCSA